MDYNEKLLEVSGVGPSTAGKIQEKFPTEEDLVRGLTLPSDDEESFLRVFKDQGLVLQNFDELMTSFLESGGDPSDESPESQEEETDNPESEPDSPEPPKMEEEETVEETEEVVEEVKVSGSKVVNRTNQIVKISISRKGRPDVVRLGAYGRAPLDEDILKSPHLSDLLNRGVVRVV